MENLNKSRAFLTEFIIVILFFSVATVITMGLFVESNNINDEAKVLSKATLTAQSVAENIRAEQMTYDKEGIYTEYLDEDMFRTEEEQAVYVIDVIVSQVAEESSEVGTMYQYDIIIKDKATSGAIYAMDMKRYKSKEVQ